MEIQSQVTNIIQLFPFIGIEPCNPSMEGNAFRVQQLLQLLQKHPDPAVLSRYLISPAE